MKILITGSAGFIGFHLAKRLLEDGHEILGLDNINDYYEIELKHGRLAQLGIDKDNIAYNLRVKSNIYKNFSFIKLNLEDKENMAAFFEKEKFDYVCHLGAQAGVRYSIENPHVYIDSNIVGFLHILEGCRIHKAKHLVFASSSSVYGLNEKMPFATCDNVDHPASLYAATKKSGELMAHSYSSLYGLPATGLRFFSVYGPWGRPDMALFKFVRNISEGKEIDVYNFGECKRDFTYIDDIVAGICSVLGNPPKPNPSWNTKTADPSSSNAPYKIYNIGNDSPVSLIEFIRIIEQELGKKAKMNMLPMQPGDVLSSWADVSDLYKDFGYKPKVDVKQGVKEFVHWYLDFYGENKK
jgi:UDP-glucuronate 4-epimerase